MRRVFQFFKDAFNKGDMILLTLCLVATAFSCLVIASTTQTLGSARYVPIQILGAVLGVLLYLTVSSIDAEFFSEHRMVLILFNIGLLLLIIPFGTDNGTGNKCWLEFPFLPVNIQPAEICKITYILIMASVMGSHQNRPSHIGSITHIVWHLLLLVGLNFLVSRDLGVSLIFVFIFVGMAWAGGVSIFWFLAGIGLYPYAPEVAGAGLQVAGEFPAQVVDAGKNLPDLTNFMLIVRSYIKSHIGAF